MKKNQTRRELEEALTFVEGHARTLEAARAGLQEVCDRRAREAECHAEHMKDARATQSDLWREIKALRRERRHLHWTISTARAQMKALAEVFDAHEATNMAGDDKYIPKAFRIPERTKTYAMQCPSCGAPVRRIDEEQVRCTRCRWVTDTYEAQKAAEEKAVKSEA